MQEKLAMREKPKGEELAGRKKSTRDGSSGSIKMIVRDVVIEVTTGNDKLQGGEEGRSGSD